MKRTIHPASALRGEITPPGDKSISHRVIMLGALAEGITHASGFLMSADCLSTIACFEKMGIRVEADPEARTVTVHGKGLYGLQAPSTVLDAGNSGTTTRLISGILAGQTFSSVIDGDSSLRKRPMRRIIEPLTRMGADVTSLNGNDCVPLRIEGLTGKREDAHLSAVTYRSPVASAQVKSCVLLAGLYADGPTCVLEPAPSRDHTERMLQGFGASVRSGSADEDTLLKADGDTLLKTDGHALWKAEGQTLCKADEHPLWKAEVDPRPKLTGQTILVPGDISSAAYFLSAALIVPDSEVLIKNVGINPTRAGILEVVRAMGGRIDLLDEHLESGEPVADLLVRSSSLHGTVVEGALIPALIDELPVIAVLAAFAEGETVIRDAAELKVKESDRIETTTAALLSMGADVTPTEDGMIIRGGRALHGAVVDSRKDHRIAMSMAVAALAAEGDTQILDADCVDISYPGFYDDLYSLN